MIVNKVGDTILTKQLCTELEQMIHTDFNKEWTVVHYKNTLRIRWNGYAETEFIFTWNSKTQMYTVTGSEIPFDMLLAIINFLKHHKK